MRLLLVEDDPKIAKFLEDGLSQNGYAVDLASDGELALDLLNLNSYDLLICDVMLPKVDGLSIVKSFRKKDQKTPVIFLSARRSVDDRVLGLQTGGDDYLTKPFSLSELLARVQALLRRTSVLTNSAFTTPTTLTGGDISLDLISREVLRNGTKIELQTKEFSLLEYFLRNQGRVLSKAQILERIWNYQFDPQTNVVDVLVFRLRSKIDRNFARKHIQNIRGVGYVFQPD
jgi:two-component system, OmpR family, response regulator